MQLTSPSFNNGDPIPTEFAFGAIDRDEHVTFSDNRNPALTWDGVPEDTLSLVLLCVDPDVPSSGEDVNQEDREVPADLPRVDFSHWLLIDIPADWGGIGAGVYSDGVTPRGKQGAEGRPAEGVNDYTGWFQGDADMEGTYKGYDGPCPPWNDSIIHHYHFTLHALDVESLELSGDFTLEQVKKAMDGHVIDQATLTGTYTLNPRLA